ncbi:hypothetical protein PSHI8_15660 [Polynucleobacter sp. SHI8]|uniref:MORN repeat-containing protein n=1 Tax=unclassified Polynucleobacter TaxID=2640945 RepID=UPI002492D4A8|nr:MULTISPECIES: hypothetical protein [unclassified Polynucleobacter]BDW11483.1 hypothetical protein PSHI2_15650 [Polynucleobacter sp. SHI2]BDW13930.1 hypothetical protein PSHI8_15660 [Polynucleobacter sp. SHI8]
MKKTLIFLSLLISSFSFAQSNLPTCNRDYLGSCYGGTYSGGDKYIGEFRDGLAHGYGTVTYSNGDKYSGQFKDNKFNGQGTYTYPDGSKFVGQHKDNKRSGYGIYYYSNGTIYQQGIWKDNEFIQPQTPPKPPVNPPSVQSNPHDIKRQKCIRLGLIPGSADFQQCMN